MVDGNEDETWFKMQVWLLQFLTEVSTPRNMINWSKPVKVSQGRA
jgi:hypothetical protein